MDLRVARQKSLLVRLLRWCTLGDLRLEGHWWHRLARLLVTVLGFGAIALLAVAVLQDMWPETTGESHTVYSFEKTYDGVDRPSKEATDRDEGYALRKIAELVFDRDKLKDDYAALVPSGIQTNAFGRPMEGVSQHWQEYRDAIMNKLERDGFSVKEWTVETRGPWRNTEMLWAPSLLVLLVFPILRLLYRILLYVFIGGRLGRMQTGTA